MYRGRFGSRGFTLIELVIVVIVLGIIAAIAIPRLGGISYSSKVSATRAEMMTLKRAIIGNPQVIAGGHYVDAGFEGDIGAPPDRLEDLVFRPDSISTFDRFTRMGWNGPYVDSSDGEYLTDAWGNPYLYDKISRTIKSVGNIDTLVIVF